MARGAGKWDPERPPRGREFRGNRGGRGLKLAPWRWVVVGLVGGGLGMLILSNSSPSLALVFLGLRSRVLPLGVWLTLAVLAGSVTALAVHWLWQSLVPPPIQVTRPRSSAGARPTWTPDWEGDEEVLNQWVDRGTPLEAPERSPQNKPPLSPWQAVAAAVGFGSPGQKSPGQRATARRGPEAAAWEEGDWGPEREDWDDWEVLAPESGMEDPDPKAQVAPRDNPDKQKRPSPNRDDRPRGQGTATDRPNPDRPSNPPRNDRPNPDRPSPDRPNPDRPSPPRNDRPYDRPSDLQPLPPRPGTGRSSGYRYQSARSARPPAPNPADPVIIPAPTSDPPAYLNNPLAGRPDAIYDVDYRVITPSPEPANREPPPRRRPSDNDWDWEGPQDW